MKNVFSMYKKIWSISKTRVIMTLLASLFEALVTWTMIFFVKFMIDGLTSGKGWE